MKLGDFGLVSLVDEDELSSTMVGTLAYMSPEILKKKPYSAMEADLWALGCVMYELTALKPAFSSFNAEGLMKRISTGPTPTLPSHLTYSESWRGLVHSMLHKEVSQRPSTSEILSNPYLKCSQARVEERYGPPLPPGADAKITLSELPEDLAKLAEFFKQQELEVELRSAEERMKKKEGQLRYAPEALRGQLEGERDEAAKVLEKVKSRVEKEFELDKNLIAPCLESFPTLQKEVSRKARPGVSSGVPSEPMLQPKKVTTMRRSESGLHFPSLQMKQSPEAPRVMRNSLARISLDNSRQQLSSNHDVAKAAKDTPGLPPKPPGQRTLRPNQLAAEEATPLTRKHSHDGAHLLPSISPTKKTPEKIPQRRRRQTLDALMTHDG